MLRPDHVQDSDCAAGRWAATHEILMEIRDTLLEKRDALKAFHFHVPARLCFQAGHAFPRKYKGL